MSTRWVATIPVIMGAVTLEEFSIALLVGLLVGAYSSIYIASALVLWWHKGQRPTIGTPVLATSTHSACSARHGTHHEANTLTIVTWLLSPA